MQRKNLRIKGVIIMGNSQENAVHIPVLLEQTLIALCPKAGGRYLDGTLGLGGHSSSILQAAEGIELCALDRDGDALNLAKQRLQSTIDAGACVHFFHTHYSKFEAALDELGWDKLDGALIDIGVSSLHLDSAERGFSFNSDGPLDMRMDTQMHDINIRTAADIVNRERFEVLKEIIQKFGEDPQAGRIARAIVDARQKKSINSTAQLEQIVYNAYPKAWRAKARNHPATRTFQALRMVVNDELGELERFLNLILRRLKIGGRLAVICFHSLEDRMVKQAMRYWATGCRCPKHIMRCKCGHKPEVQILYKKPITATEDELRENPRASSAKLRAVEKIYEVAI